MYNAKKRRERESRQQREKAVPQPREIEKPPQPKRKTARTLFGSRR